ncbi:MAG: hypothetical protein VXY91_02735 [Bacteroidota bacterium]|nr:hypothetical protein [Bacteroidota bacterium]
MKNLIIILFAVSCISCKTVYYQDPQPIKWPALPSFPKSIQGEYPAFGEKNSIIIEKKRLIVAAQGKDSLLLQINKDVVIKRYARHWVVSLFSKEQQAWEVYAIDNNRSIKILQWKDGLENTLNAHFGKTLIARDEENELMPMEIKRREFRYILKNHFSGVNMKK